MKKLIFVFLLLAAFAGSASAEDWVNYTIGTEGMYLTIDLDEPIPIETTEGLLKTMSMLDCTLTVYDETDMDEYFVSILKKREEKYIFGQGTQVLGSYWYKDGLVFKLILNEPMGGAE